MTKSNKKNKRTDEEIISDRELIKKIILEHFSDKEFKLGDVYNKLHKSYNKSRISMMYVDFKVLTVAKFLKYRLKKEGVSNRAIYSLVKYNSMEA